jgi:hypothetical protein
MTEEDHDLNAFAVPVGPEENREQSVFTLGDHVSLGNAGKRDFEVA